MKKISEELLLKNYFLTGNLIYRDQVIENYMAMVKQMAHKYSVIFNLDYEELEGYGFEGLVSGVINYKPDSNKRASAYIYHCIKNSMLNGMPYINGFVKGDFYSDFITCKSIIEKEFDDEIINNSDLIDRIIDLMHQKQMAVPFSDFDTKSRIAIGFSESLEQLGVNLVSEDIPFELMVEKEELYELIKLKLKKLPNDLQNVLSLLYGLDGNEIYTQKEIADIYSVVPETVRSKKVRAFNIISNSSISKLNKEYLEEIINSYDGSSLKLARKL